MSSEEYTTPKKHVQPSNSDERYQQKKEASERKGGEIECLVCVAFLFAANRTFCSTPLSTKDRKRDKKHNSKEDPPSSGTPTTPAADIEAINSYIDNELSKSGYDVIHVTRHLTSHA